MYVKVKYTNKYNIFTYKIFVLKIKDYLHKNTNVCVHETR